MMDLDQQILFSQQKMASQHRTVLSHSELASPQPTRKAPDSPNKPNTNKHPLPDRNAASSFEIRLTNPEQEQHSHNEQALQKLIDMNEDYLRDKIKVSDVPKPSKYAHKMPSKTGNSEYNRKYTSLTRVAIQGSTPQRDKTGSIMRLPNHQIIQYASTYNNDYKDKQNEVVKTPNRVPRKYQKSQAPGFIQSSYHRDYQSVAASPAISAKRAQVRLMGGGKLSSDTTYKQCYRMKTIQSGDACRPIVHKDNKIFIAMQNPQQSIYRQTFACKPNKQAKQISCKPAHKYTPIPNRLKYKTEYNDEFVGQRIQHKADFECLSREELKLYVMTILKE